MLQVTERQGIFDSSQPVCALREPKQFDVWACRQQDGQRSMQAGLGYNF
jgi:hypothetical protein